MGTSQQNIGEVSHLKCPPTSEKLHKCMCLDHPQNTKGRFHRLGLS